ncbi:MAG TPA: beta-phosphoglucomutase [Bacteroidales bacterium]|nr:beta-phosphoglucomutase [Bacteroidales bacterium]
MQTMWFDACIFDLDGVIVDTAKYHFLAWKRLADMLDIPFSEKENEKLKGVSRLASLEIILELSGKKYTDSEKAKFAEMKNTWYVEFVSRMTPSEILPGAIELLTDLKSHGIKTAIGSASKNTLLILEKVRMKDLFDTITDGNMVKSAKPDPEIFLVTASMLNVKPDKCIVFEDSVAGIKAAHKAGMYGIGVGNKEILIEADYVINDLSEMSFLKLTALKTINQ